MAISPLFLIFSPGKQLHPIFESPLRSILIDRRIQILTHIFLLGKQGIQIVHGLDIEQLDGPFKRIAVVGEGDILQGQIIFNSAALLLDEDSAALRVESSHYPVFGKIYRQLNKLLVEVLDGLIGIFVERIFERVGHVLVHESNGAVLLLRGPQIDIIFVADVFEFVHLLHQ